MSMSKAKKNKGKKSFTAVFVAIFMLMFSVVIGINFINQTSIYQKLKSEEISIQKQIDEEKLKSVQLENEKEYYSSDAYVEKAAREQLGMVKPDEVLYINRSK